MSKRLETRLEHLEQREGVSEKAFLFMRHDNQEATEAEAARLVSEGKTVYVLKWRDSVQTRVTGD